MIINKTIEKEIKRLCQEPDSFIDDNFGSQSHEVGGIYEVYFSESRTEHTLRKFAEFILKESK